jgi:hypothetical protein
MEVLSVGIFLFLVVAIVVIDRWKLSLTSRRLLKRKLGPHLAF